MRKLIALVFSFTITAAPAAVMVASNLNFLRDAPISYFTKADTALLQKTMRSALDEAQDGETRSWSNTDSGNSGEVTVSRTLPAPTERCRELEITNHGDAGSNTQRVVFCHQADQDRWAVRRGNK